MLKSDKYSNSKVTDLPHKILGEPVDPKVPESDFIYLPRTAATLHLKKEAALSSTAWRLVMGDVAGEHEAFGIKRKHLNHVVKLASYVVTHILPGRQHNYYAGAYSGESLFLRCWLVDGCIYIDLSHQHHPVPPDQTQ